jgi:hypothetical protein
MLEDWLMPSVGRDVRSAEIRAVPNMELTFDVGVRVTMLSPWSKRGAMSNPLNVVDWPHYLGVLFIMHAGSAGSLAPQGSAAVHDVRCAEVDSRRLFYCIYDVATGCFRLVAD